VLGHAQTGAAGYYNRVAKLVMQGVLFENNTAQAGAGALEMNLCNGDVQTCVFAKNKVCTSLHAPQCTGHLLHVLQQSVLRDNTLLLAACNLLC
jgi:hypothetical protein